MSGRPGSALRGAFTLIEMLAVLFLISLILGQSVRFYFDISDQGQRATERVRQHRRAAAILDRVAQDLQHATLVVKPAEMEDPLEHPWIFVAEEGLGELGAERVKFIRRGGHARGSESSASDLAVVTYGVREGAAGDLELWRQLAPGLPDQLDRSFALDEDEGAMLLADGLALFGIRFLGEEGEWKASWDSSNLVDSDRLPRMAEIGIAMSNGAGAGEPTSPDAEAALTRRVMLPLRPFDLAALLEASDSGEPEGEEEDCVTIGQCLADRPDVREALNLDEEQLAQLAGTCVTDLGMPDLEEACLE
ncbi:MAG: prepilin-type N-terminal cleavage/methylation domain-containing protein [Deltaproteobacteria bacterium]|nr:MAG: prepilin-type N-terminal cleavage/methylation domain-containing protein [Deltaproteobacteria bacterium]